ncbi:hypothetical protein [Anatilimnocola floriformis]|uniref:hypothetical protein n=1 Tax=Anatilimnocola floriformis TaxID=2948575 RepID=UPI0020C539B8|nr:hypothetical protein [Anatilimnocola floriformis]
MSRLFRFKNRRQGTSSLEVVVAFTLLSAALVAAAPLIVAHNRLMVAQRHHRIAMAEISNQMESLSLLATGELPTAVERLTPSEFAVQRLPGVVIRGELSTSSFGQHVALELSWDEVNRQAAPVRLTTWLFPEESSP